MLSLCHASGKTCFNGQARAEIAARHLHVDLNAHRRLADDTYGYRCPSCRSWHPTRRSEWDGAPNVLLCKAGPEELQRWAFPPERLGATL